MPMIKVAIVATIRAEVEAFEMTETVEKAVSSAAFKVINALEFLVEERADEKITFEAHSLTFEGGSFPLKKLEDE